MPVEPTPGAPGPGRVQFDASWLTRPDASDLDLIARLLLQAQRRGHVLVLLSAGPELIELLDLAGVLPDLAAVLPRPAGAFPDRRALSSRAPGPARTGGENREK